MSTLFKLLSRACRHFLADVSSLINSGSVCARRRWVQVGCSCWRDLCQMRDCPRLTSPRACLVTAGFISPVRLGICRLLILNGNFVWHLQCHCCYKYRVSSNPNKPIRFVSNIKVYRSTVTSIWTHRHYVWQPVRHFSLHPTNHSRTCIAYELHSLTFLTQTASLR